VKGHGRPQQRAVEAIPKAGEGEHSGDGNIVKRHRGDQPSRSAAIDVTACQPADMASAKIAVPPIPRQAKGSTCFQRRPEQKRRRCGGHTQQRQACPRLNDCGHGLQSFHDQSA
jgi:hypothetical protein